MIAPILPVPLTPEERKEIQFKALHGELTDLEKKLYKHLLFVEGWYGWHNPHDDEAKEVANPLHEAVEQAKKNLKILLRDKGKKDGRNNPRSRRKSNRKPRRD